MDKAFDANWLRDFLAERSIVAVIPPKSNRKNPASCDMEVYKWRHLIENFFQKLKEFKRIAMRACKTACYTTPGRFGIEADGTSAAIGSLRKSRRISSTAN